MSNSFYAIYSADKDNPELLETGTYDSERGMMPAFSKLHLAPDQEVVYAERSPIQGKPIELNQDERRTAQKKHDCPT